MAKNSGRVGGYLPREARLEQIASWFWRRRLAGSGQWYSVHDVAHAIGLRPSHHVRGLIGDLVDEHVLLARGGGGRGCTKIRREYQYNIARDVDLPF